jgi:predicted SAM-dependent methyltransferase
MNNVKSTNLALNFQERQILLEEFQEVVDNIAPPFSSLKRLKYSFGEWLCLNFTIFLQQIGCNRGKVAEIRNSLGKQDKIILNIGCQGDNQTNYVNADLVSLFGDRSIFKKKNNARFELLVELTYYDKHLSNFADGIVLSHVLEHIHPGLAVRALKNCLAYLKPGACLRVSVPDLKKYEKQNVMSPEISGVKNMTLAKNLIIYAYKHQFMFDLELLMLLMEEAGFQDIKAVSFRQGLLGETDVSKRQDESIYVTGIKAQTI